MKRRFESISSSRPGTVEEVRDWLHRVELFEQVNWDLVMPYYGAVTHLLDDDFMWDWSPACTHQYEAVAELTGIFHVLSSERPPPRSEAAPNGGGADAAFVASLGGTPSVGGVDGFEFGFKRRWEGKRRCGASLSLESSLHHVRVKRRPLESVLLPWWNCHWSGPRISYLRLSLESFQVVASSSCSSLAVTSPLRKKEDVQIWWTLWLLVK